MKTKPLSPSELPQAVAENLPDFVIEAVNACLMKTHGSVRTVLQDDIIAEIRRRYECERSHIFDQHWLDFEDAFRSVGWDVRYEKPAYNEIGPAFFEFKPKR